MEKKSEATVEFLIDTSEVEKRVQEGNKYLAPHLRPPTIEPHEQVASEVTIRGDGYILTARDVLKFLETSSN